MSSELINQVLKLTNIERTNAGLQPLKLNSQLANAAQDHSGDMAKDDFYSHTGADGSNVANRVQDSGYQYSTVGENIAAGQKTAEQVVEGWMNSPGHRANILNANFTEIGIGYEYLANDTGSVNYNHYWTQVFGTSLNSNQGTNSEPLVSEPLLPGPLLPGPLLPENSDPTPEKNIDNSADINEKSNLEVTEENSDSTSEVENSEQSEVTEEITDNASDSNDTIPEPESNLEVVEENSDSTPELEVENSGESEATEEITDDSFELNNSITFDQSSFDQSNDSLISKSNSVALAGDDDAIAMFDSPKTDVVPFGENFQSNFSDLVGNSTLGMAMEGSDNYESIDIMEYSADSSLGVVKHDMTQEFADSFL